MPALGHGKPPEETLLLEVPKGGTQPALEAIDVPDLIGPQDRERGARAGAIEVHSAGPPPTDFQRFSARYWAH